MTTSQIPTPQTTDLKPAIHKRMIQVAVQFMVMNAIVFLAAGTLN